MTRLLIRSFAPISDPRAETLILGSMPGQASLLAGQYYAHAQNTFWRIMGALLRFDPAAPYAERIDSLKRARIALWDVLQCCERAGSLDARIDPNTEVPNALSDFLRGHRGIRRVFFNGAKAENAWRRFVQPSMNIEPLLLERLPSTSPAHATLRYEQKLALWRAILEPPPCP